ncbi:MAG: hypothetical protein NTV24_04365 [Candidatus Woesebacteria bacterium]|nr:hypothetical protein [Candidatus Woesebacteria bacterium]
MIDTIPGVVTKEEEKKIADEWQEEQDRFPGPIPPVAPIIKPRVKIISPGQPLHLHKPHDIGNPSWMNQDK